MKILAMLVFAILSVIAALHAYWGLGGLWPGTDVRSLIDTVIGDPRFDAMPAAWMTFAITGLIFASGVFAQFATVRAPRFLRLFIKAAIAVIASVFLARGVSGYTLPEEIRARMSEPFSTYDQLYYSPLCLILGVAYVALFFARPRVAKELTQ